MNDAAIENDMVSRNVSVNVSAPDIKMKNEILSARSIVPSFSITAM